MTPDPKKHNSYFDVVLPSIMASGKIHFCIHSVYIVLLGEMLFQVEAQVRLFLMKSFQNLML